MLKGPLILNIRPGFCAVQGCDIARSCEGYITSEDTKLRSFTQYIGPLSLIHIIYCMVMTSSCGKHII